MQFLIKKTILLALMSRFSKVNLQNELKHFTNIQLDKLKVYQKLYGRVSFLVFPVDLVMFDISIIISRTSEEN